MGILSFGNFNVTFGETDAPLLDYFETVLYPALTNKSARTVLADGCTTNYFFDDVNILQLENGEYILCGYFIKDTFIKIETVLDEGILTIKNEKYPTAPYSIFVLFLKNHRVALYQNERLSPDLRSFNATIKYIIDEYIKKINKKIENIDDRLPNAKINIIGLPMTETMIEEKISSVKKIKEMKVKLFPLNGDCDFTEAFACMRELNNCVDSKKSDFVLKSPKNRQGVSEVISNTHGLVDIVLDVEYRNGTKGKIKSEGFTEKMPFSTTESNLMTQVHQIASTALENPEMKIYSEENKRIFERNLYKIIEKLKMKF